MMVLSSILLQMLINVGISRPTANSIIVRGLVRSVGALVSAGVPIQVAMSIAKLANIPDQPINNDIKTAENAQASIAKITNTSYLDTAEGLKNDEKLREDLNIRYKQKSHTELYFDRLYSVYPDLELDSVCQYVILIRPDLNIFKPGSTKELNDITSDQSSKGYSSTSSCANDQVMRYMNTYYNNILRHLTSDLTEHNDFMPYLLGRTESLQIPDYSVKNYYITQPFTGLSIPYAGNALESLSGGGGTFEITFREDGEFRVHKLFQAWVRYIDGVVRNLFSPMTKHIVQNKIDYATSVYCITCKADGVTIIHWAKYTGAFPISVPNSDISFNLRGSVNNKVSIPFAYFLAEPMDPLILVDFNKNAHVNSTSKEITERLADSVPVYSTSKLKDYNFSANSDFKSFENDNAVLGTGYGLVGAPFVYKDPDTKVYKLGWKNPYN
jgi:hypothetical protein